MIFEVKEEKMNLLITRVCNKYSSKMNYMQYSNRSEMINICEVKKIIRNTKEFELLYSDKTYNSVYINHQKKIIVSFSNGDIYINTYLSEQKYEQEVKKIIEFCNEYQN